MVFNLGYKTWVHHGEPALPPPPPVRDNTRQLQMSDMTASLNDLSYIPPNNKHNEPTQGDIDTPSVRVLAKTAYVGHRRFLKKPHKWRSSREFNGQTDNRDPPKEFGRDEILAQLDRLPTRLTGKHLSYGGVKIKRNICQRHVDNDKDPEVSTTSELFALACGPTWTPISINSCVVDGVRYVVHNRDERRTTQNSGICSPGPDGEMYYGQLQEILEFKYLLFKVVLFRVKWFDTRNQGHKVKRLVLRNNMTQIDTRDGQPTEVDAPPDIIDVVDEDDDIIDDEDPFPHDLADSDDEDFINVDDDCVDKFILVKKKIDLELCQPMLHGKGKRKTNLGGRAAGRLHTRDKTRNLSLKDITDKKGPVPIRFEVGDKQTLMPLGDHAAHWSSYIGEVIRGVPLYYPSWLKVPKERKAALITDMGFWNDPRNIARAAQNRQNRAKSTVISRQGSLSLARLRDEMRQSSATQEYPSLIDTFFIAHTVDGVFTRDEDRLIYEEMRRLEATGTYTDDEINRLARGGKQRGHIPGVGRVLPARATASPSTPHPNKSLKNLHKKVNFMMSLFKSDSKYSDMFAEFESGGASGSGGCGDDEESADDQEDEDGDGDGDS
ncbi:F-box domain containing protein [Tanacetum coccineum]